LSIILVGNSKGKLPLARRRRRWEDDIKLGLKGIGPEGVDFIHLVQDTDQWQALMNTVMNIRIP
jgi:hypothetical protein